MERRLKPGAPPERGPLTVVLDGLLLFLALSGTVFSFSTAFSLQVYGVCLLAGCGLGTLVFLAVFSLPRYRWAPLLALAAGWGGAVWRLWDVLVLGEISLRCSVVNSCVASLGAGNYIQPIAQLPDEAWREACTALVLVALVPIALLLGFAIVRQRSFWLAALACLPLLAAPLAFTITPAWLPLMAVLACWGTLLLSALAVRGGQRAWNRARLAGLFLSALVLPALSAAMPREGYRRPAWADRANDKIANWAVELSGRYFSGLGLLPGGGGGLAAADQRVDLAGAGPLRFSGRTVLDVRSSDLRGRVYLRGFSSAVYDGEGWGPLEDEDYGSWWAPGYWSVYPPSALRGGAEDGEGAAATVEEMLGGFQPINFPALARREGRRGEDYAKISVRAVGPASGYVYHPYHLLTTPGELSGAAFVQDAYLAAEEGVDTHTLYLMPEGSPLDQYALPAEAGRAEGWYGAGVLWMYTRLPDSEALYLALKDWANKLFLDPAECLAEGEGNEHYRALFLDGVSGPEAEEKLHKVGLVRDSLAFLAQYDPDTPATPEGEDFVAYFLTQGRRGYCMHFASAATLLLRFMGMPARYVSGYVADIPASGRVQVPDSNAHAWVEVYMDGYGWYPVEVTPAYAGGEPGVSGGGSEEALPTPAPTATPMPTRAPAQAAPTPTPAAQQAEQAGLDLRPLWTALAALLVPALPALRRRLACRVRRRRFAGADTNRAVIDAYRYLTRLARCGGGIPERAQELAEKAKFSQHALTPEEREAMSGLAWEEAKRLDAAASPARRLLLRYFWALC